MTTEVSVKPEAELIKARARLRKLMMVNPNQVHLFTRCNDPYDHTEMCDRWISDRYVMVNVTGDPVVNYLPNGAYKLTAAHGLQPSEGWLVPDTAGLLNLIESRDGEWQELYRTDWSVADSPAKLQVAYVKTQSPWCSNQFDITPIAINEGVFSAFDAAFPGCQFWYREGDPYKVTDANGYCVAYVATSHFPTPDLRAQALVVAGAIGAPVIPWEEVESVS